ncbi:DDE-type integrase/transposase/recombinase [Hansschlegelia zhihuaiae]|uniref:Integrase n=1 Tax=Hansschlegelia zhihuaiae TaxID=405005 RepID=A0A4Q0MMT4_9HYPH|nr:DDE-type integrase/transposase/recombinase [Hansschlegelia zhihuaiae]RXF75044.1 integrase [Hansschlegelia zhihuaiae]
MKEWLTAREIATEALPALPETERGVQLLSEREGWNASLAYARPRSGRGGGFEYNVALFPTLAQLEYKRRHLKVEQLELPIPASLGAAPVTDRERAERDARLAVLAAFERFSKGQRLKPASLAQIFVARYNSGTLPVDPWVRERICKLSKRSLQRWRLAKEANRTESLGSDPGKARAGTGLLDVANGGRVRTHILALIAHQPHISAANVRKLVRAEFGDELVGRDGSLQAVPPVRTFQHAIAALKRTEQVALTKLSNPDRYRSTMAPRGVGALRHVTKPNQLWQIDASPADAQCIDGRHAIYVCLDVAPRRIRFYVSKTPRAAAVGLLIRRALLAWGVPETIKTDNGSDFVAAETKRLFASLGIEAELSPAYTPQAKGHVERAIRTVQHDLMPLLPGYVGHSVADRKQIEDRKGFADRLGADTAELFGVSMTGAELQAHLDAWAEETYAHKPHAGLKGATPFQAAAASPEARRMVDERALDVLLMPVAGSGGVRTVQATGVRIDGHHFVLKEALPGDRVLLRMDPLDAGRAFAFDVKDGRHVGEALCAELAGIDPKKLLAAKKAMTAEILERRAGEAKAEVKRLVKGRPLIERTLEVDRRDAPNVLAFPKPEVPHTTPEIAAALDVTREAEVIPLDERAAAMHAQLKAELEGPALPGLARLVEAADARAAKIAARTDRVGGNVAALPESPKERFRRAKAVLLAVEAGEVVDTLDAVWAGGYAQTPEYRAHQGMLDIYGEEYLAF